MTTVPTLPATVPIFVYGTLKRGGLNHHYLSGQRFVGEARTIPGFRLYDLDGYPGMVPDPVDNEGVTGELWEVDTPCLAALDEFEGVPEGLYRREIVPLAAPHANRPVTAYIYARTTAGRRRVGSTWQHRV